MIAGQHHHADAGGLRFGHRLGGAGAQRVGECDEAAPRESELLQRLVVGVRWPCFRDRQHAQSARGELADHGEVRVTLAWTQAAQGRDRLRCTLARNGMHPAGVAPGHGNQRQSLGEREFVFALDIVRVDARRQGRRLQCAIHGILRERWTCEGGGLQQDPLGRSAWRGAGLFATSGEQRDLHPVFGERARLVRAQHGDGAHRFDRRWPSHQCCVSRHAPSAQCQEHGHDDRELLGNGCDRQRQAREQRLEPVTAQRPVQCDHDDAGEQGKRNEQQYDLANLSLHRCGFGANAGQRGPDASHFRAGCRGDDLRLRVAAYGEAAGMHQCTDRTCDGCRLPREQGGIHVQVDRFEHPGIGDQPVALREVQQVAHHDLLRVDHHRNAVAHDACPRTAHRAQRLEGAFGFAFLMDRQADDDKYGGAEQRRFSSVAQQHVHAACREQEEQHGFTQHASDGGERAAALGLR